MPNPLWRYKMRIATIGGLRVLILQNVRNESLTRVIIFILLHRQG